MTLDQVPVGTRVLVDANVLVYHFQSHPGFGPMCHRLMERIERQDIKGVTFSNLLGEAAHRLMLIEAATLPGWAGGKVLNRLKQQPSVIALRPGHPRQSPGPPFPTLDGRVACTRGADHDTIRPL